MLHATSLAYDGKVVLIQGASGSGKSGLALQMIISGGELISDDKTILNPHDQIGLVASAPPTIKGKIEARGVGILNAPVANSGLPVPVALVVDMDREETHRLPPRRWTEIAGVKLPLLYRVDEAYFYAAILYYLQYGRSD